MLHLLADENFNGDIVRGSVLHEPSLDIVRAHDVGLGGVEDRDVLQWSSENNRIILTHDRATMPAFAQDRLQAGQSMPGVLIFSDRFPVGRAIEEILLINACSEQEEWIGRIVFLPL